MSDRRGGPMSYNSITWLPLCAALTGVGLVISYFMMRRRGLGSGLRGAAWSLLPVAAYLTGSIEMFWKIGTAIGNFAAHLVLSPKVWSGVGVAALAGVLFVASAPAKRRRKRARKEARGGGAEAVSARDGAAGTVPAGAGGATGAAADGTRPERKALQPTAARAARKQPA